MDVKKILIIVVGLGIAAYWLFGPSPYKVGDTVSDFSLSTIDGDLVFLEDYQGKVVLIEFFTTSCPVCRKSYPQTAKLSGMFEDNPDVEFLSINRGESPPAVRRYMDKIGKAWPVLLDPDRDVYDEFFKKGVPAFVVIDRDGKLSYRIKGWWTSPSQGILTLSTEIRRAL